MTNSRLGNWLLKPFLIANFILLSLVTFSLTSSGAVELATDKKDYNEVARIRSYVGGADEEDIKVKENIVEPNVSLFKSTVHQEVIKEIQEEKEKEKTENETE